MNNISQAIVDWQNKQETYEPDSWDLLCHATDEIERLSAEVSRLRYGLSEIVRECSQEGCDGDPWDEFQQIARTALDGPTADSRQEPYKPKCSNCGDFSYDCKVCGGKPRPNTDGCNHGKRDPDCANCQREIAEMRTADKDQERA